MAHLIAVETMLKPGNVIMCKTSYLLENHQKEKALILICGLNSQFKTLHTSTCYLLSCTEDAI